jgi:hypothetical protein
MYNIKIMNAICDECQKMTPAECYSTCCACGNPVCHNCVDPNESYYCKPHQHQLHELFFDKGHQKIRS